MVGVKCSIVSPLVLLVLVGSMVSTGCGWGLSDAERREIDQLVQRFLQLDNNKMWAVQDAISPQQPFILFHQRKD